MRVVGSKTVDKGLYQSYHDLALHDSTNSYPPPPPLHLKSLLYLCFFKNKIENTKIMQWLKIIILNILSLKPKLSIITWSFKLCYSEKFLCISYSLSDHQNNNNSIEWLICFWFCFLGKVYRVCFCMIYPPLIQNQIHNLNFTALRG